MTAQPRIFWGILLPVAHSFIALRLVAWAAGVDLHEAEVSDTDVAYLCKTIFRDPHTPVGKNKPETCPVHSA